MKFVGKMVVVVVVVKFRVKSWKVVKIKGLNEAEGTESRCVRFETFTVKLKLNCWSTRSIPNNNQITFRNSQLLYHMNLPTPSLGRYRNTPIVTALITTYHTPSNTSPQLAASTTCALIKIYGIRKYRGSSNGVGRSVGRTNTGSNKLCRMVCSRPV